MGAIETIESMGAFTKAAYAKIAEKGGDVPSNQNIAGLGEAIRSISTTPPYDPSNPTLDGIKAAMQAGDFSAFPIGVEIPDTYAGNSNPLIVAQYLDSSNNSSYGKAEGVILVRKYVEATNQVFGISINYSGSSIKTFLDGTYLNNCSDTIKAAIANINIPYYNGSSVTSVSSKWFLMSAYEVCNYGYFSAEGIMWNYWKQKTGLSTPDSTGYANSGRIARDRNGTAQKYWLRSRYSTDKLCVVNSADGGVYYNSPSTAAGVLPACFIAK